MTHLRSVTTAIAVLLLATPLIAQSGPNAQFARDTSASVQPIAPVAVSAPTAPADQITSSSAIPSWVNAVSTRPVATTHSISVRETNAGGNGPNVAMMVVGGAGILLGAVVGGKAGTVVMIGGTAVGLIGLWRYVK
jgi:hypothetical protein